ncbi:MAG: cupredoxin domain-containing protein [Chloroflexi bacterium]|nr:cupredoxin domain-containing protein [Chloroflexota bacterium]
MSRLLLFLAAGALIMSACASEAGTVDAPRRVDVVMTDDLRFDPDSIAVREGETVRFTVSNPTALDHEFVIGDSDEQAHHAEEMMSGEGIMHDEEGAIGLAPGESKELVYTFAEAGELEIACHVDGHYEAGMRGAVTVEP